MTRPRLHDAVLAELERTASQADASANSAGIRHAGSTVSWSATNLEAPADTATAPQTHRSNGQHPDGHHPDGHDSSVEVAQLYEELRGLRQRQASLGVIEQAKGMLMGYYGISADAAFAVLRRWSQDANVKLREIAAAFVAAGAQPDEQPYGAIHAVLRRHTLESSSIRFGAGEQADEKEAISTKVGIPRTRG
jgi:ANTAR domain